MNIWTFFAPSICKFSFIQPKQKQELPIKSKKCEKKNQPLQEIDKKLFLFIMKKVEMEKDISIRYWADDKQSKARNSDSKYRQMALVGFDT